MKKLIFIIKELFLIPKYKNREDTITDKTINNDAFVNEISYPKASRGTSVFIVNCSTGDFIINFFYLYQNNLLLNHFLTAVSRDYIYLQMLLKKRK